MALPNPYRLGGNALTSFYLRPKKKTVPTARATPTPRVTVTPPSPAPFDPRAQAETDVQSIIDAMLAQVQREQDAARAQAQAEAQFEIQKGQALAEGLKQLGISGAIQGIFQGAGNNQAALAQGFSGALRADADAAAAEQARMLSGTGQEGAVRNQGANLGNVTYGLGGYIPASSLNTAGAAFGAQAALQPGFALQFGQMNSANRLADYTNSELPDFLNQRLDIIGQRPSLMRDLLNNNRDYENTLYERNYRNQQSAYARQQDTLDRKERATATKLERKDARKKASQERTDRMYEAAALKLAYGYKLTNREKWLINHYGMTPEAVEAAGKAKEERADDARSRQAEAARDRATAARQKASDKRRAMLEAQKAAARSKLESDKAAYRKALEEYKSAQRQALEAQKALSRSKFETQKARLRGKKKKKGGAASSPDSYFGG